VGYYSYWLKIPEAFLRQFREKRNLASFFNRISYLIGIYGALSVAFIFYLKAISQNRIDWRSGLRPALIVLGVSLLAEWNYLPLAKSGYSTTENYTLFWIEEVYITIVGAIFTAVPIYFLWSGGQQIAKQVWPQRDMILPRSPNRLIVFTQSYWRGLMLGGIGMGYLVIFYLVATYIFGSWSPMDVNYSNLFSTPFPFLNPLTSGILPAIEEELDARLIGIGIILLLTRSRWLALVVSGGLWAFAHLSYVADPFYLRGIELWLPAIFLDGLFFLRFGLLTTIVGHCFYNAFLGASSLMEAQDVYLFGSGVLVIILLLTPLYLV
jgi:membrane protease YdiL (CAAX protease family)